MTSQVVKDDFKNGAWWKNRSPLERTLILTIAFVVIVAVALAITVGVLKAKDPAKEICLTPGCIKAASTVLQYVNTSADPCEDFYEFACGTFLATTHIPDDKVEISQFSLVDDNLQEQLRVLIQEPIQKDELRPFKLVKQYYQMCMNLTRIEELGLGTINVFLRDLGGWPVVVGSGWDERDFDWKKVMFRNRETAFGCDHIISFYIGLDDNNSTRKIVKIDQANINLSRKIFLKGWKEPIVKAYYEYMVDIAVIFGADRTRALKELKETVEFEMKLANISVPPEERRNASERYNPMTIAKLQETYPSIPWLKSINMILAPIVTVDEEEVVILTAPSFVKGLEGILKSTPKRVQANYLMWNMVREAIPYLNEEIRRRRLKYETAVNGRTESQPRWKDCIDFATYELQIAAGAMYVRRYYDTQAQDKVMEMVNDIRAEFMEILQSTKWIDPVTKTSALKKAELIETHIGRPSELLDDSKLEEFFKDLKMNTRDFLMASLNISLFYTEEHIGRFREPNNKTDWRTHSIPAVVNAYYDTSENSIQFPAGILQGTFFNKDRPQYMNYGSIGYIIGHEITHGFDDEGRQYDAEGNLIDWWQPETHKAFKEKAQCIIDQYNNYTAPEVSMNLNGINTQGENIADNGGMKQAYLAYRRWVKRNGSEQKLPGLEFSPKQLFWISAANTWCAKTRSAALKLQVLNGFHSPARFRTVGPFSNSKHFSKDFACPLGSPMNPEHKCEVW